MRGLRRILALLTVALSIGWLVPAQAIENNRDRPGSDYSNFNLPIPNPTLCQTACNSDNNCKAWTYVRPGVQGPTARCWLKNAVPPAVVNNCCVSDVKPAPLPPPPAPVPPGAQANRDRPGDDIVNFPLPSADPALCQNACNANGNCKAWTYVKPGVQGPQARCWIKDGVPAAVVNNCCVSGVKPQPPTPIPAGALNNRDRPGSDIANYNLPAADPTLCQNACNANGNCKAWTYVRPGVQGPSARCWLKNAVPAAVVNNCCVSGVKPLPPPPPPPPLPAGAEVNRDRPGSDFSNFNLASADPNLCANACTSNGNCKAWTYVKPGVQGPSARCWLKNAVPPAVVSNCCVSGVKPPPPPPPLPAGALNNRDRPGSDYASFNLAAPDPNLCANACTAQGACQAWTYVKPGFQGPSARCWLKNGIPPAQVNNCCVSGIKTPAPPPPLPAGAENNTDRFGNDYTSFELPSLDPNMCANACTSQDQCAAWTYVRPGYQGENARCYLKAPAPPATPNNCCVSGVKPVAPAPVGGFPFEPGFNRPGSDYADFSSGGANTAILCMAACGLDPQCKAWTFVKPGLQGPQSHCWLKTAIPPAVPDSCCTSGVK